MRCLNQLADLSPQGQITEALADMLQNQPLLRGQGEESPLSQSPPQERYKKRIWPVTVRRLEQRGNSLNPSSNRPVYGSAIAHSLAHLTGQSPEAMGLTLMTQIQTFIKAQAESQNLKTQGRVFPEVPPTALNATRIDIPQKGLPVGQSRMQNPSIWSLVDVAVNSTAGLMFSVTDRGMVLWLQRLERQVVTDQATETETERQMAGDRPLQRDGSTVTERAPTDIIWFSQYAHARCAAMLRLLLEVGLASESLCSSTTIHHVDVHELERLWLGGDRPSLYAQSANAVLDSLMRAADAALEWSADPTARTGTRLISAMAPISHAILQFQARFPPLGMAPMGSQSSDLEHLQIKVWFALTQVTQKILHLLLVNVAGAIAPETL